MVLLRNLFLISIKKIMKRLVFLFVFGMTSLRSWQSADTPTTWASDDTPMMRIEEIIYKARVSKTSTNFIELIRFIKYEGIQQPSPDYKFCNDGQLLINIAKLANKATLLDHKMINFKEQEPAHLKIEGSFEEGGKVILYDLILHQDDKYIKYIVEFNLKVKT